MTYLQYFIHTQLGHHLVESFGQTRTRDIMRVITPFLNKKEKILDIGSGLGFVLKELRNNGYHVQGVDIHDISIYPDTKPVVYDGKTLPYASNSFDTALLLTVLHHIPDPLHMLRETMRVARKIIIKEEIYSGSLQRYCTYAMDSVTNMEFFGHPHTNHSDDEWKAIFSDLKLRLVEVNYSSYWRIFSSAVYVVEKR